MVALKPKRLSELVPNNFGTLGDIVIKALDKMPYYCRKCNAYISREKGKTTPKFCGKCGTEIDWGDLFTKTVRVCPTCKKESKDADTYCIFDGTELTEKTVSK
jgi:hypothetical protein